MINTDKYIWQVEDHDKASFDFHRFEVGWYFQDESEQLQGPFGSRQEALDALDGYVKWLNGYVEKLDGYVKWLNG